MGNTEIQELGCTKHGPSAQYAAAGGLCQAVSDPAGAASEGNQGPAEISDYGASERRLQAFSSWAFLDLWTKHSFCLGPNNPIYKMELTLLIWPIPGIHMRLKRK